MRRLAAALRVWHWICLLFLPVWCTPVVHESLSRRRRRKKERSQLFNYFGVRHMGDEQTSRRDGTDAPGRTCEDGARDTSCRLVSLFARFSLSLSLRLAWCYLFIYLFIRRAKSWAELLFLPPLYCCYYCCSSFSSRWVLVFVRSPIGRVKCTKHTSKATK